MPWYDARMARTKRREGITGRRLRQEKRRLEAGPLFEQGKTQSEVARLLGVKRQSVHVWHRTWKSSGATGLAAVKRPGPPRKFDAQDEAWLGTELRKGALAHGYPNALWTVPRVRRLLAEKLGKKCSGSETWRLLQRIGYTSQKPVRRARERKEDKITLWKTQTWPALCARAAVEKRQIIFVDESGLSLRPPRKASFAPRGQPDLLSYNFNWDKLSAIGAVSTRDIYFRLHDESVKSTQVIEFVEQLRREVAGPMLIIWDGLRAHWSKIVKAHIAATDGQVVVEQLPAYAPELNPVEYLWSHLKRNDLANLAPKDLQELSTAAHAAVAKVLPGRAKYLHAFWIQTELDLSGLGGV